MSDALLFIVSLVALYLAECVYSVPIDSVIFRRAWFGRCRPRFPIPIGEGRRKGLVLSNPLPPFGKLFLVRIEAGVDDAERDPIRSLRAVRRTQLRYRKAVPLLRAACTMQFVMLFVALPLTFTLLGSRSILYWLAAFTGSTVLVLIAARSAYRVLRPNQLWWSYGFRLLVYPPAAMQAVTQLGLEIFASFHPVAVAAVLGNRSNLRELSGRFLRELTYPVPSSRIAGEETRAGRDPDYREALLRQIMLIAEARGLYPTELLGPPAPLSADTLSYCPRCLTQYVEESGCCSDCSGVRLLPTTLSCPSGQCGS